jgi:hypothetical protein
MVGRKNAENTGFRTTVVYQGKGGDFTVNRRLSWSGRSRQRGQGMVEYALILVLQAVLEYSTPLNKIATGTFLASLGAVVLIGWRASHVHRLLTSIPVLVTIGDWSVPLVGVVIALAITLLTRRLRWHDRISDALGIRERFDVTVILLPLAVGLGVRLGPRAFERLRANRRRLMTSAFYQYTEGTSPILTPKSVTAAMDRWSWFWILFEGEVITAATAVILLVFGDFGLAALLFVAVLGAMPLLYIIRRQCDRYAQAQVDALLTNPRACQAVLQEFIAI